MNIQSSMKREYFFTLHTHLLVEFFLAVFQDRLYDFNERFS